MSVYQILDVNALLKIAYLGSKDPEALYDPATDTYHNTFEYGAARFLERFSTDLFSKNAFDPRHTICVFDAGIDYRRGIFPDYKAKREQRKKEESTIGRAQWKKMQDWAVEFFKGAGFTSLCVHGVEADDVIAWLCLSLKDDVKVVRTVDGDLTQLVDDKTIVHLRETVHFVSDEDGYKGVPYQFVSLNKSIVGDKSDEYPGIKGMGPSAWEKLHETVGLEGLAQLQNAIDTLNPAELDALIEQNPSSKELAKLRSNWSTWRTMWMLAKLHPELCYKPMARKIPKVRWSKRVPNGERLLKALEAAGCADYYDNFKHAMPQVIPVDRTMLNAIHSQLAGEIAASDVVAFDYESTDVVKQESLRQAAANPSQYVDMLNQRINGAGFCFGAHGENVIYISCEHANTDNCDRNVIVDFIKQAQKAEANLVAHNAYFEGVVTARNFDNYRLANVHDTMILSRYIDENELAGLKECSKRDLNYEQASFKDTTQGRDMCELSLDEVLSYGADDALVTFHLYDLYVLKAKLDGCWEHYSQRVVNATPMLVDSYLAGVRMDWDYQAQVHLDDINEREDCKAELREILSTHCRNPDTPEHFTGVKSYMDYCDKYLRHSTRQQLLKRNPNATKEEIEQAVKDKIERTEKAMYEGCVYETYVEQEVMPAFALTVNKLAPVAEKLGLPELTTVAVTKLPEYFDACHFGTFGANSPTGDALEWLTALSNAVNAGAFGSKAKKAEQEALDAKDKLTEISQRILEVEPKLVSSGTELSLGSSSQVQKILYGMLALPVRTHSKLSMGWEAAGYRTGGPGTDETAITTLLATEVEKGSWKDKTLRLILRCKSAMTRISLYHEKFPLWRREGTDFFHPTFRLCGTDTRRPTGGDPNMLQVSKKDKRMRRQVIPPNKDYVAVAIDYASQEIRLMASESKDPAMCSVYLDSPEKDLHSMTGSAIIHMSYDDFITALNDPQHEMHGVVNAARKSAKTVNFGLGYGAGPMRLAIQLIITLEEAKELQAKTMGLYSRLPEWKAELEQEIMQWAYVTTSFGSRRHARQELYSSDKGIVASWVRRLINFLIQGTAAEMLNMTLCKMWDTNMLGRIRFNLVAPIYDEVFSFVHKDDVQQYCEEMREIMSSVAPKEHCVPHVPEFSIGAAWGHWGDEGELGRDISPERVQKAVAAALKTAEETIWDHCQ